jgi:hypothetical protein
VKKHAQHRESELKTGSYEVEIAEKKHVNINQFPPETGLRVVIMAERKQVHLKDVKLNKNLGTGIAWEEAWTDKEFLILHNQDVA